MRAHWPRRLTISVVAAFCVTACGSNTTPPANVEAEFYPVAPAPESAVVIPFPFNGLYSGFSAPTLNIPNSTNLPFVSAANELDGFSTVGDLFFDIAQFVDYRKVGSHILIYSSTGQQLVYGIDFTIQSDPATEVNAINGQVQVISSIRSRILIEPLKPFAPATTYFVAVTAGIPTLAGGRVVAGPQFKITSSSTPVSAQNDPYLENLTSDQIQQLEAVRSGVIYPTVAALGEAGLPASDLVLAWPFTTQSIGKSLAVIAGSVSAAPIAVEDTGITTTTAVGVPGAEIYAGTLSLPYYLQDAGGNPNSTIPLTTFWLADPTQPDLAASFLGQVPCGAFASGATVNGQVLHASTSTTICYPVPLVRSVETIPLLIAVPNSDSGRVKPATGWPVVVFEHGIGGDRTNMLAIAPAFAQAGFAVAAIDLPLHGITDNTNAFYQNQLFAGTPAAALITGERTFNLDLENNSTGAAGPDGLIDPSGTWFINLSSLLTSRDNLREAEADLMSLTQSLAQVDLNQDGTPDLDVTQIRFNGISLGSIAGIPFLANNRSIGAASLAVPGGGIAKLLDASATFGPIISAGLAASGIDEGTDDFETFLRFAQQAVDDGDPLNYAIAARAAHPIHMIEVIGDLVVPNAAPATPGTATENRVTVASDLAGTNPLYATMGLTLIGPINVPVATPSLVTGTNLGEIVQFNQGSHTSLLDPSANAAATQEMQEETVNFLSSNGSCLPIGENCPAP